MKVLEQYKIEFKSDYLFEHKFKSVSSINESLSSYISEHNSVLLTDRLLSEIQQILSKNKKVGGWDTNGMVLAIIALPNTIFYDDLEEFWRNENIEPTFRLPTEHFKIIIESWREYLLNI